ncbi:MAG: response regulator [Alphaproteobacteria bacterium]|nr:response regulator [Alphaproteobacteria bacterium]
MKFCLIVDDSDVIRKVACKIVEGMGHIAVEAETAEAGLRLCQASMPDMILLDWQLPGMSSMDFLAELGRVNSDRSPQILYAVTEADPHDLARAYRCGIAGHILKPYDRQTLGPALAALDKATSVLV